MWEEGGQVNDEMMNLLNVKIFESNQYNWWKIK